MRKDKPKIQIASSEEVAEYASGSSTQKENAPAVESAETRGPAAEEPGRLRIVRSQQGPGCPGRGNYRHGYHP